MNCLIQSEETVVMEVQVVEKIEVYEVLETLLDVMEDELVRELFSLSFCDAWLNAEHLLIELDAELKDK